MQRWRREWRNLESQPLLGGKTSKIVPLRFPVFEPSIPIRHVYSRPASVNLEFIAHLPYDKAHHPVNTTRKRVARR